MSEISPAIKAILDGSHKASHRAVVGFDGSVDVLYRVVHKRQGDTKIPFADIAQFGKEIASRAGLSGGFELSKISRRAGGNAPLMAAALAALGAEVSCVGALGMPTVDPAYLPLAETCKLVSVADAPSTWALEFEDGKIMLGDTESLDSLDWKRMLESISQEAISELITQADLLAMVNWTEMPLATGLWRDILEQVLAKAAKPNPARQIFFDLADITRRHESDIREMLTLLGRFRAHGKVTLGLNENEARQLEEKLELGKEGKLSLEALGRRLMELIDLDTLVIHPREGATVFQKNGTWSTPGRLVAKPVLSTGGGDNFNAGFCTGLLHGLEAKDAAALAVMVSSSYVANGRSPKKADLAKMI